MRVVNLFAGWHREGQKIRTVCIASSAYIANHSLSAKAQQEGKKSFAARNRTIIGMVKAMEKDERIPRQLLC